jgi:amino acid transporter
MVLFIGLNLRGVGEAGGVEIVLVWFKLAVLVGLAGWGLASWNPPMLSRGVPTTFSVVCGLAFHKRAGVRIITGMGALTAAAASVALFFRLVQTDPVAIVFLALLIVIAVFGRPVLLRHVNTENRQG